MGKDEDLKKKFLETGEDPWGKYSKNYIPSALGAIRDEQEIESLESQGLTRKEAKEVIKKKVAKKLKEKLKK